MNEGYKNIRIKQKKSKNILIRLNQIIKLSWKLQYLFLSNKSPG